jgi:predicted nuclease of predicted toxin-antitoxin system
MRFLVDECTGKRFAELLRIEGYDVVFAGEELQSVSDDAILKFCEMENRILITDDKDFGELVFRVGRPAKGVILLRISPSPEKRMNAIKMLLERYDVKNKFIVLEEDVIRSRTIV